MTLVTLSQVPTANTVTKDTTAMLGMVEGVKVSKIVNKYPRYFQVPLSPIV